MGVEYFESNRDFDELREPIIPPYFLFIFNTFLEIYNLSGEYITWTTIKDYCIIRNIKLRQSELELILKCNNWANAKTKEMRDEQE